MKSILHVDLKCKCNSARPKKKKNKTVVQIQGGRTELMRNLTDLNTELNVLFPLLSL
jgi:hypothetical protein